MTDVKMLKIPARPKNQIAEFIGGTFNLPKHMAEHIYMFSGESVWVKFWADLNFLDAVVDWFGKDFKILQKTSDKILINVKVNSTAMKFWAMQYGGGIEIISPESLRFSIQQTAKNIFDKHC